MSAGTIAQTSMYILLVLFWCAVFAITIATVVLSSSSNWPRAYRQIQYLFIVVSGVLFLDSGYWAVTNIATVELLPKYIETFLRTRGLVATEKSLVLLSGVAFLALVLASSKQLAKGFEQAYFTKLVEHTWDAIGILSPDGKMKIWNTAAVKLFGWQPDDVLGLHIKDFMVPKDQHADIEDTLNAVKYSKTAHRGMRSIRLTKDGKRIPIDITISPILDEGEFQGFFGSMRRAMPNSLADFWKFQRADADMHPLGGVPYVFVAMPFAIDVVSKDAGSFINEAISESNLLPYRTDYGKTSEALSEHISACIAHADLVVADLTGGNLNVYYELGLAYGFGQKVIQLVNESDLEKLPFDIRGIRTIAYSQNDLSRLKREVKAAIQVIQGSPAVKISTA